MNEQTIAALDDDEFADELREHMMPHAEGGRWDLFLSGMNVRRTLTALEEMQLKVEMQLETHGDENPEWFKRANNFKRLVTMRLKHANRMIYQYDGSHAERERKLRAFAHELCAALDGSDKEELLDEIFFPFDKGGKLSAGEWYDRRLEKRAAAEGNPIVSIERDSDVILVAAMSTPTPLLALEAVRKTMCGDARATEVLRRWQIEHPEIVIQAFTDFIAENAR